MYIWTHAKHVWNDGAGSTARETQLDAKKLCPSPCPLQSGGGYPSWPAAQLPVHEERRISAEQPQPTAAHHTIRTARRPDHIRLSALVRSRSTQFTAHPSCELGRGAQKRGRFSAILAGLCGCQEWLGLLMYLQDELICCFVLAPRSWSCLFVLRYLCFRWIRKQLCGLQTGCLWTSDIAICTLMCQSLPRQSVSQVTVAYLYAAPSDNCVCNFVHVSARSQGTDICLYW